MTKTIAIDRSRELALGFLYWLTFLIALDSGDLLKAGIAAMAGEAPRLVFASLLGGISAPVMLLLMRRFPVERGERLARHLAIHVLSALAIAFALIVVSCLLAPLFQIGDTRPFLVALPRHLQANWLLLAFCIFTFAGLAHAARSLGQQPAAPAAATERAATSVPVKTRGQTLAVALGDIDWIETQGNYLALHAGSATHLVRETLVAFEERHANAFIRIHRRMLVASSRVRAVTPSNNGDAEVHLLTGASLKVSRSYAKKLRQALAERILLEA